MNIKDKYKWEIELNNGRVITDGNDFNPNRVIRVSFVPSVNLLPRYDIIFDGFSFIKRFCRGFVKTNSKKPIEEYLHCIVTDKFRVYLKSSNGQYIITGKDYEMYI